MEILSVRSTRERERERERESKHKDSIQNNNAQSVHSVCLVNTFIQVHMD